MKTKNDEFMDKLYKNSQLYIMDCPYCNINSIHSGEKEYVETYKLKITYFCFCGKSWKVLWTWINNRWKPELC